ncbi:STAS domain-containing protein [Catellatospora bangladeshensis]|uniref:STAS domain-containing protein n=1 Tax=Catellatospora bangladeshensis TaxID=310355 RepID=A0A8J3JPI2_9ACTN|nr:STAS domain-containing protein [Catellatospora bangladeshensis]GIF84571.1 hypothetical protein Cba03nite_59200 [Catellatospora bangladeshensis]
MNSSRLHLRLQATSSGLQLVAHGRLNAATARQLGQAISLALHRLRARRLSLDLTAVDIIDAAGVAALIRGRVEADRCAVTLTIADPSPGLLNAMRAHARTTHATAGPRGASGAPTARLRSRARLRLPCLRHRHLDPMR